MTARIPITVLPSAGLASTTDLSQEGQALLLLAFILVQSGKYKEAMNVLEGLRHGDDRNTACLPLLTHCYLELGLFAEALPLAQEMAQTWTRPTASGQQGHALCATRMLAQAMWGLNRKEEARAVLDKALQCIAGEEEHAFANS